MVLKVCCEEYHYAGNVYKEGDLIDASESVETQLMRGNKQSPALERVAAKGKVEEVKKDEKPKTTKKENKKRGKR